MQYEEEQSKKIEKYEIMYWFLIEINNPLLSLFSS